MMNEIRFSEIVTAYGADPARWPLPERAAALAFLRDHADIAEKLRADAGKLDDLLKGARSSSPAPGMEAAILASAEAETRFAPPWTRLAAVLALSAGLGLGWGGASLDGGGQDDAAYAMAFSSFAEPALEELTDFMQDEVRQ